jgi:hypothetical protein
MGLADGTSVERRENPMGHTIAPPLIKTPLLRLLRKRHIPVNKLAPAPLQVPHIPALELDALGM